MCFPRPHSRRHQDIPNPTHNQNHARETHSFDSYTETNLLKRSFSTSFASLRRTASTATTTTTTPQIHPRPRTPQPNTLLSSFRTTTPSPHPSTHSFDSTTTTILNPYPTTSSSDLTLPNLDRIQSPREYFSQNRRRRHHHTSTKRRPTTATSTTTTSSSFPLSPTWDEKLSGERSRTPQPWAQPPKPSGETSGGWDFARRTGSVLGRRKLAAVGSLLERSASGAKRWCREVVGGRGGEERLVCSPYSSFAGGA